jgi:hypothetical protein
MRVPTMKGVATHIGSESCAAAREDGGEALTGERVGRVLSCEIHLLRGADVVEAGGRPHRERRQRETPPDPAQSETPSMHGRTSHGNQEIPSPSAVRDRRPHREVPRDARR